MTGIEIEEDALPGHVCHYCYGTDDVQPIVEGTWAYLCAGCRGPEDFVGTLCGVCANRVPVGTVCDHA